MVGGPGDSRRGIAVVLVVVLALAGVFAFWDLRQDERAAYPQEEGRLEVTGLGESLSVIRDRRGIPHVRAGSDRDAWYGLGFVHAQDRLGQMLWLRRVAHGRTAERIGSAGLASDRRARLVGLEVLAEKDWEGTRPEAREALEAYALGVNAWLGQILAGRAGAPLGWQEEPGAIAPWTPVDSLALWKLHAFTLAVTWDESLVLQDIVQKIGAGGARPFFPKGVGLDSALPADALAQAGPPTALRSGAAPLAEMAALREAAGRVGASVGSAAFVVGGGIAERGLPLLAVDVHLPPRVPAGLYQAHLRGGTLEVAGGTLPGIPVFWVGYTPRVAWASTWAPMVAADLVQETLHGTDPRRYRLRGRWRSVSVRSETIGIRGGGEEQLNVRATERGPLVDEVLGADQPLALQWTGAGPGGGIEAYLRLPRVGSAEELRQVVRSHQDLPIAVAFVTAGGAAGWQLGGALPRRQLPSGLLPVPAGNATYAWDGMLPPGAMPGRSLGPGRSWAVIADAPLVSKRSGIEELWRPGARSARIEASLAEAAATGPVTLAQLAAIQADLRPAGVQWRVDRLLALAGENVRDHREEREVIRLLEGWNGEATPGSRGAAVYHVLRRRLLRSLLEPALGPELLARYLALPRADLDGLLDLALGDPQDKATAEPWMEPAFVADALRKSLRETWLALSVELGANRERWTWGRLQQLRFEALWPGAWPGGRVGPFPFGGDGATVAVAEVATEGWTPRVVSAYRLALDAADLDQALTSLAPGQSEHPGHRHATDGVGPWLEGRPRLLSTSDPVIEDGPVARLDLVPRDREKAPAAGIAGAAGG
jgi:penicillin amidase